MIAQPDLFTPPPRPAPPVAARPPPPFDLYRHPCVVCGAPDAPFGLGWPHEPKFYCRQHHEAAMPLSPIRTAEVDMTTP